MLKSFEPRENVCLYLCEYNLWSSWAVLWGWGCSGAAWRVPLGVRRLESLGPCQQRPVAMVIGECSHWGLAGSAGRFRGQIYGVPRAASSPELVGGRTMGSVISFPSDVTDTLLDSVVHCIHSVQHSRHGGWSGHRGDTAHHSGRAWCTGCTWDFLPLGNKQ